MPQHLRESHSSAWRNGVTPQATAVFARWWQLETWLRELAHVELRAKYGQQWRQELPHRPLGRQERDERLRHMPTPDSTSALAYLDVTDLLALIESRWQLFGPSLIDKDVWAGRVVELKSIRNRIGHCRRPHREDLSRLEQTLRDLEGGAFQAVAAFNRQYSPSRETTNPIVRGWLHAEHEDADRLLDHALDQYDVAFALRYSVRPWTKRSSDDTTLERSGLIWHATWYLRSGGIDLRRLWQDNYLDKVRESLIFLCSNDPFVVDASFAAVDDPSVTSDLIGNLFDAILLNKDRSMKSTLDVERWTDQHADLDPRVQAGTAWSLVTDDMTPITLFGV